MALYSLPAVLNSRSSWFHCRSLDSAHSVVFQDASLPPSGLHIWVFRFVQVLGCAECHCQADLPIHPIYQPHAAYPPHPCTLGPALVLRSLEGVVGVVGQVIERTS
jgi:hypothetical protein